MIIFWLDFHLNCLILSLHIFTYGVSDLSSENRFDPPLDFNQYPGTGTRKQVQN